MDKMDHCYQPHIFEPAVLARDNDRFNKRATPSTVRELKNVMATMIEERTLNRMRRCREAIGRHINTS